MYMYMYIYIMYIDDVVSMVKSVITHNVTPWIGDIIILGRSHDYHT